MSVTPPLHGRDAVREEGMRGESRKGYGQRQTWKKETSKGSVFRVPMTNTGTQRVL